VRFRIKFTAFPAKTFLTATTHSHWWTVFVAVGHRTLGRLVNTSHVEARDSMCSGIVSNLCNDPLLRTIIRLVAARDGAASANTNNSDQHKDVAEERYLWPCGWRQWPVSLKWSCMESFVMSLRAASVICKFLFWEHPRQHSGWPRNGIFRGFGRYHDILGC